MMTKTRALVLRTVKYGERGLIVDMLSEEHGRLSFMVSIGQTQRSRMKKQLFQPLSMLDLEFDLRPNVHLQRLKDVRVNYPYSSIPFDPYKLSISLFIAEFLLHATRDEQSNEPLFAYLEHSLQWLDGSMGHFANFHLVFMMRLSRFIGFFPNLEDYQEGCCFDLRNGEFTPQAPLHRDFVQPDEAAKIGLLMRMDYETMRLFRMSRTERNRCAELILSYYRLHVPGFPQLRSLSVVQELF